MLGREGESFHVCFSGEIRDGVLDLAPIKVECYPPHGYAQVESGVRSVPLKCRSVR